MLLAASDALAAVLARLAAARLLDVAAAAVGTAGAGEGLAERLVSVRGVGGGGERGELDLLAGHLDGELGFEFLLDGGAPVDLGEFGAEELGEDEVGLA